MAERGLIRPTRRDEAVARAYLMPLFMCHRHKESPPDFYSRPHAYRLEDNNGGKNPYAEDPGDWSYGYRVKTSDCIGFITWAAGFDRFQKYHFPEYGGWINTDSILEHAAAGHEKPWFKVIDAKDAKAGDFLVVGSTRSAILRRRIPGHIKMIVRPATPVSKILVVDCSPSNGRESAIMVKEQASLGKYKVVRYTGYVDEAS